MGTSPPHTSQSEFAASRRNRNAVQPKIRKNLFESKEWHMCGEGPMCLPKCVAEHVVEQ